MQGVQVISSSTGSSWTEVQNKKTWKILNEYLRLILTK